jgi:hypothetical protein
MGLAEIRHIKMDIHYMKSGKTSSRSNGGVTVSLPDGNNEKRDYMKSGRSKYCAAAASNWKVKPGSPAPGNTSKRDYPKRGM